MMIGNNYKNYIRLACLLFIASNFSVLLAMPNFNEIDEKLLLKECGDEGEVCS